MVRFSPPPNWPTPPPGWRPPPDWRPDPSWPPPPDGWRLWTDDVSTPAASTPIGRLPAAPPASSPLEHAPLPAQRFSGYRFNVLTEWLPTVMNLLRRIRCTAASMGFGYIRVDWPLTCRRTAAASAPQVCWKMTGSAPGLTHSVAPFFEREQDGPKGLPGVSQEALVAWRTLRILPALDHACLFEFAQPCGEHVAVPRCSWLCLESGCVRSESRGPPAMHSGSPQG